MNVISHRILNHGFLRAGLVPYVLIIGALFYGAESIYTASANREPLTISVAQFAATKPKALWVNLTEASLDLSAYACVERAGTIQEMFIPINVMNAPPDAKAPVMLSIKDMTRIDELMKWIESDASNNASHKVPELVKQTQFSGLIRFSTTENSTIRGQMANFSLRVTDNYLILNEGQRPDMLNGILCLIGGIGAAIYVYTAYHKPRPGPPPLPRATP